MYRSKVFEKDTPKEYINEKIGIGAFDE